MAAFIGPVPFGIAVNAQSDGKPERVFGHLVSPEYFSTLGVEPLLGRFFDPAQEARGVSPTVVVSERFWRTRLHADPHVAGRALRVNGRQATIIGVEPKDFFGIFPTAQAVQQRRKEIGIRMALGARPAQVLRLVMREGAVLISAGAAFGFAGAYGISRALAAASAQMAEIIGWSTGNRALTAGIPLLLVSLALIACYLPARRSASLDPLVALREE